MGEMPFAGRDQERDDQLRHANTGPGWHSRPWVKTALWFGGSVIAGMLLGLVIIAGHRLIFDPEIAGALLGIDDEGEIKRVWADLAIERLTGGALIQMLAIVSIMLLAALLLYVLAPGRQIAQKIAIGLMITSAAMTATVTVYASIAVLPLR